MVQDDVGASRGITERELVQKSWQRERECGLQRRRDLCVSRESLVATAQASFKRAGLSGLMQVEDGRFSLLYTHA